MPAESRWWPAISAGVALLAFMALLIDERIARALGLLALKPHFMDWAAILAAGDAHRAGADIYATPNPFDPLGRPHCYGPWWVVLGDLGFTIADRWWMGALVSGLFLVGAAMVLAPQTPLAAALTVGILISPPVFLGVERANNDLVVFLMLTVAAWMVAHWRRAAIWGTVVVVVVAAVLKIYPLAALSGLPAVRCRPRVILTAAVAAVAACIVVAWLYRGDYARTIAAVPKEITLFTYGIRVFAALAKTAFDQPWSIGIGIASGLGLCSYVLGRHFRQLYQAIPLYGGTAFASVAGAACWVFCYFVNTNLPYRAVLLLLPARLWLREWSNPVFGPASRRCFALILLLAWTACATGNVHDLFANGQGSLAPRLLTIASFEQTLALVVTATLLLSLVGWTVRYYQIAMTKVQGDSADAKKAPVIIGR